MRTGWKFRASHLAPHRLVNTICATLTGSRKGSAQAGFGYVAKSARWGASTAGEPPDLGIWRPASRRQLQLAWDFQSPEQIEVVDADLM